MPIEPLDFIRTTWGRVVTRFRGTLGLAGRLSTRIQPHHPAMGLGARMAVVLIGERPGLSPPDSLGASLTRRPRPGARDSGRNRLSDTRPDGLPFPLAPARPLCRMTEARRTGASGVCPKQKTEPTIAEGVP